MKFLVSPAFRYPSGLRRMLLILLALLFLFNCFHALNFAMQSEALSALRRDWQEASQINTDEIDPSDETADPGRKPGLSTSSLRLAFLEGLHIDLFIFSLEYLLLFSLFLQLTRPSFPHRMALHLWPAFFLTWLCLRYFAGIESALVYRIILLAASFLFYSAWQLLILHVAWKIRFRRAPQA